MVQVVKLSYDAELLAEAVMSQYFASEKEIYEEFEKLGFTTDEEKAWFQSISFAFTIRHEGKASDNLRSVPPLPETLKAKVGKILTSRNEKDSNLENFPSIALTSIDGLPDPIFDTFKALSVLGMAAWSLDAAALCLSKDEEYDEFISFLLLAREALARYRLRSEGIKQRKLAARANALKRHKETYMLRSRVIECWKTNISPTLSNENAADVLLTKFKFPLSHRKLKEYVRDAKREMRPASTAYPLPE